MRKPLSLAAAAAILFSNIMWIPGDAAAQVPLELPGITVNPAGAQQIPAKATNSAGITSNQPVVSPTANVTPSEQVASSVTVLTSEELQRTQQRTVPDALRTVPGLHVVQSGGPGALTSVYMRGTNADHTKVLIDGIDIADASSPNGAPDLGHLLVADIERIEILRGPQSGLYGANTIGGVISIITKKGSGPPRVTGYVEGGSFGTFNQAVGVSGSSGIFNYALNVGHYRSTDSIVTPKDLVPPGRQLHDFYDNWTYTSKFGWDFSKYLSVNMVARYTDSTKLYTASLGDTATSRSDYNQFAGRAETVLTLFDGAFKNYFGVSHMDQFRNAVEPFPPTREYKSSRDKYDWRGVVTVAPGQIVVMGAEHQKEWMSDGTVTPQETNKAGYIELQSQLAKRVFLAANARIDDNETFGTHTTWRIAPSVIVPGTETKLKGSVGTAFKAPSLYQRFGFFSCCGGFVFAGNPNLTPESSLGYDFGFEQPLLNDKVRFGATYFHNDIKDLINGTATSYENVGRATTSGVEAFASWAIASNLLLRGDYTYTHAVNELTGQELTRRPSRKMSATVAWSPTSSLNLSGTVLHVGGWYDNDRVTFARVQADAYTTVNLAADYKVSSTATLFGRVDNLFDVRYQDPVGYLKPGLGVFGGLRLTMN